ncbi:hypothetical protein R1sor_000061 [Riccia sorocarpa]|uniref:CCHC-type domain-containing protein n=1 Tax=Riccia sorocarpa TaxID=122646 RepID=A0ABD3GY42_9MARC
MEVLASQIAQQTAGQKGGPSSSNVSMKAGIYPGIGPNPTPKNPNATANPVTLGNVLPKVLNRATGPTASNIANSGAGPSNVLVAHNIPVKNMTDSYASKVAAGEQRQQRHFDGRPRNFESWKAARALTAAAKSAECVGKNKARFQRLHNVNMEETPYPELKNDAEMTEEKKGEIRDTFRFLRQSQVQPSGKVVRASINSLQLANRLQFLKEKTFVLYTVDISPARDTVVEWAEANLHHEMGIKVSRVRVLNKHYYLITVQEEEDRDLILDAAPLYLGPHMVFALPWDPAFDSSNLDNCKVPIWVELPNIHPSMEAFGMELLETIGEVLFTSCEETDCHYTSIRGCLKMDLSLELPEAIEVQDLATGETFFHPVLYKSMPNACFHCHQRGHVVRNCPVRRQKRQGNKREVQENQDGEPSPPIAAAQQQAPSADLKENGKSKIEFTRENIERSGGSCRPYKTGRDVCIVS